MSILWLTSFNTELYEVSGQFLLKSKEETKTEGDWFIGHERFDDLNGHLPGINLDQSSFLSGWLNKNKHIIPKALGGNAEKCKCKNPEARSEKSHRKGCHHTWFNRNASRWFRKIATLFHALEYNNRQGNKYDKFIWIDSDCEFIQQVTERYVDDILFQDNEYDTFYLKGTERKVMEAGLVGYNLDQKRNGLQLLWDIIKYYSGNRFTRLARWDDSYVIQKIMWNAKFKKHDLATTAGDFSEVFSNSLVKDHIIHNKGKHGRKLGIMK